MTNMAEDGNGKIILSNGGNLRRLTTEEARKIGIEGAKKSIESRRKKIAMSQIYAEWLITEHKVTLDKKEQKLTGRQLVNRVMTKMITRSDATARAMLTEMRKATEGTKLFIDMKAPDHDLAGMTDEALREELEDALKKRDAIRARQASVIPKGPATDVEVQVLPDDDIQEQSTANVDKH
jgi:hypothetical protein